MEKVTFYLAQGTFELLFHHFVHASIRLKSIIVLENEKVVLNLLVTLKLFIMKNSKLCGYDWFWNDFSRFLLSNG